MINLIYAWVALAIMLFAIVIGNGKRSGPLVMAYFIGLSLIHVPGALCYLGADAGAAAESVVQTGFEVVLTGLACLLVGAFLAQQTSRKRASPAQELVVADFRFATLLIAIGLGAYFVALPIAAIVPSATSLTSSAGSMLLLGFWNYFYQAQTSRNISRLATGLAALPLLPLSTMISGGFAGFGIYWMISAVSSIYVFGRQKLFILAVLPGLVFAGLSFAVAYFADRSELREQVWYERASLGTRIETVVGMVTSVKPLDINDREQTEPLRGRMNESLLLGTGIERHREGGTLLLYGETVSLLALVPRTLWPDKPAVGGGGDLVTQFTGIRFATNTSVGAGQPLEFYMNFGMWGIVLGFTLWGFILARLDIGIRYGLTHSDMRSLFRAGLPGVAMLQPGGNLVEILVGVVASVIVAFGAEYALQRFRILDVHGRLRDVRQPSEQQSSGRQRDFG